MEPVFRDARLADIEDLFWIRARTRENAITQEQLASIGITSDSLTDGMDTGRVIGRVCSVGSKLVAFCLGDSGTGEVLVLAVLPEYELMGIGTRLLAAVVERLRAAGCPTIWLAASANPNIRAYGFYRSRGWRPNGQMQGADEILMLG